MLYLVTRDFVDPAYTPMPIELKVNDVVELDDASANHINRALPGCIVLYLGQRELKQPSQDRMIHAAESRATDDKNIGVMKAGDSEFKAVKDAEKKRKK